MIGIGPSINTVFRSRWKALWWAGGVCLTAYCSVPHPGEDNAVDSAQVAQVAQIIEGAQPGAAQVAPKPEAKSPWALESPDPKAVPAK